MSASSLSMAATTGVSSPAFCDKISSRPLTPLPVSPQFLSKPKTLKPLKLEIYIANFSSSPFPTLPQSRTASATFDGFEVSEEDVDTEVEDSEVELHKKRGIDDDQEEEEAEQRVSSKPSDEAGRIYVGNLPYSMASSHLAEIFGEAGAVISVEVIYDRVTDRSRGFGFVTMGSAEEAQEAIRMFNGSEVGGRTVRVNFPEVPRGGEREVMGPKIRNSSKRFVDSPHKIYAGNLGWGLTSEALADAFARQPGVLGAKVIYERASGRSRGFGFISFETAENADSALVSMNGVEVEGRPLRLNLAGDRDRIPSSPSSERNSDNSLDSSELLSSIGA